MSKRDLRHLLTVQQDLEPQTVTGANAITSGAVVDMTNHSSCLFTTMVGTSGDTLATDTFIQLGLEECATSDGTFTAVAATDIVGETSGAIFGTANSTGTDGTAYSASYIGNQPYVRQTATLSGTHTTGTPLAMLSARGHKNYST